MKSTETGAISLGKTVSYKLDKTAPAGEVRFDEMNRWNRFLDTITFDLFYKDEARVKAEGSDSLSGVASVEYLERAEPLSLDALMSMRAAWAPVPAEGAGIPIQDAKRFICYVRITDNAGNISYLSTDGAEYDTTAPVISGIEGGLTYYTTQKANVTDEEKSALELINDVEEVEGLISELPESVTVNDEAAIMAADEAYNTLSEHGKSLVSEDAKETLEEAKAALAKAKEAGKEALASTGDDSPVALLALASLIGAIAALLASRHIRRAA